MTGGSFRRAIAVFVLALALAPMVVLAKSMALAVVTDGPLTPLMNLRGRTNESGYLRVSGGAAGSTDGPLTPLANLRGRTDENGYLRVSLSDITGPFYLTQNALGTTSTDGFRLRNQTAAAAGAQQISPRTCWEGQGWKTDATAASQSVVFCMETLPVQGTSAPSGSFILKASINGGAFSTVGTFTSAGAFTSAFTITSGQSIVATNDITYGANSEITEVGRNRIRSVVNGNTRISNNDRSNTFDITLADWGTTSAAESVSVADATVLDGPASGVGILNISIGTDNRLCQFELTGTAAPVEIRDGATICSITKDTATSINVYYETDKYKIQNLRGGTRAIRAVLIGG
jgi:hypothetical protein